MTRYFTEKSGGKLQPLSKRLTENQENRRTYCSLTHSGHFQACAAVFSQVNSLLVPYRIYSIQQQKSQQIHIAQHLDFILYFALSWKSVCLLRNNETCHNNYEEDYSSIILVKSQLLPHPCKFMKDRLFNDECGDILYLCPFWGALLPKALFQERGYMYVPPRL